MQRTKADWLARERDTHSAFCLLFLLIPSLSLSVFSSLSFFLSPSFFSSLSLSLSLSFPSPSLSISFSLSICLSLFLFPFSLFPLCLSLYSLCQIFMKLKMGTNALLVSLRKFSLVAQRCIILGGPKQSTNVFQDMDRQL